MTKNKIYFLLAAGVMIGSISMTVLAANGTADALKSRGRLVFDNNTPDTSDDVIFDASDLTYLADKIDVLKASVQ